MNPFTYLWNRWLDSGWRHFFQCLHKGWKLGSRWDKAWDVILFALGIFIVIADGTSISWGYFFLIILVLGQGWTIKYITAECKRLDRAFMAALELILVERKKHKEQADENSGA